MVIKPQHTEASELFDEEVLCGERSTESQILKLMWLSLCTELLLWGVCKPLLRQHTFRQTAKDDKEFLKQTKQNQGFKPPKLHLMFIVLQNRCDVPRNLFYLSIWKRAHWKHFGWKGSSHLGRWLDKPYVLITFKADKSDGFPTDTMGDACLVTMPMRCGIY